MTDKRTPDADENSPHETPFERARRAPAVEQQSEQPWDEPHWEAVDQTARETDDPESGEAAYEAALSTGVALDVLGQRYVAFLEEWYDDAERPIAVLKRILERDRENRWALEKLSLLLTLGERWDELLLAYDESLATSRDVTQRISLLEAAARIAKDFAGQAQRASDYLKSLLLLKPADAALAQSLERRLLQQERHQDLVDIWEARLTVVEPAQATLMRAAIADRQLTHLANPGGALASAEPLLSVPDGGELASQLLERLAATESPLALRQQALARLKKYYAEHSRIADVIRILEQGLALATSNDERISLNRERLTWNERHADLPAAQRAAAEWLALAPESSEALAELQRLAALTGDHTALAEAMVQAAGAAERQALRADLLLLAANTQNHPERSPRRARELYAIVLAESGSERSHKLTSGRELLPLLVDPESFAERLDVLEQLAFLEATPQLRRTALGEGASLAEKLEDDARALRLWTECLTQNELDLEAHDARVRILSRVDAHEDLLLALRARFEASADEEQRRADLVASADLLETTLERLQKAVEIWREVENVFGRNDETVDRLTSLLEKQAAWPELVELLSASARAEVEPGRRAAQLTLLSDVFHRHLSDPKSAITHYSEALQLIAAHGGARAGAVALLQSDTARSAAAEALANAYATTEEWEELLALVELRLDCHAGVAPEQLKKQQEILLQAAEVSEDQAAPDAALSYVARAFALIPTLELEAQLQRLAVETSGFEAAVDAYAAALSHSNDSARNLQLLLAKGRICEEQLKNGSEALAAYRAALVNDSLSEDAATSVVRAGGALGEWESVSWAVVESAKAHNHLPEAVVKSFEQTAVGSNGLRWVPALDSLRNAVNAACSAEATEDSVVPLTPRISHDIKYQLARWYQAATGAIGAAIEILSQAVDEHRDTASLAHLIELQRRDPSEALVQNLLKLSEIADEPLPHLSEASEVALHQLNSKSLAAPILSRTLERAEALLKQDPTDAAAAKAAAWTVENWGTVTRSEGNDSESFALLERGAKLPLDPAVVREFRYQAATLAASSLGQSTAAAELCRKVLESDVRHEKAARLLAEILEREGRYEALIALRAEHLELAETTAQRLDLRLELSRILGLMGDKDALRLAALRENLAEEKGHAETIDALTTLLTDEAEFETLYTTLLEQADALNGQQATARAAALYADAGTLATASLSDVEKALFAYRASVSLLPTTAVLDALATIHSDRAEYREATAWLSQRLSITPLSEPAAREETSVRAAQSLLASGKHTEALQCLETALQENQGARDVRKFLSDLREEAGDWQAFADLIAGGVPYLEPAEQAQALRKAAEVNWRKLNRLAAAVPLLEQAYALEPEDQALRLALAEALRQAGQGQRARVLLEELLEEFGRRRTPERAKAHYELALVDRSEQRFREALDHLDAASNILRSDLTILKTLGDVAQESGEFERAERAYRALLLLVSRTASNDEATQVGESSILFELYRIAQSRGEGERAKDLLDSATQSARQNHAEARRFEAALHQAARWDLLLEALLYREETAESPIEKAEALHAKAEALVRTGKPLLALEALLKNVEGQKGEQSLKLSQQIAEQEGLAEHFVALATPLAESLTDTSPRTSSQLRLQLGTLFSNQGNLEAASAQWRAAQLLGQHPQEAFSSLAKAYKALGQPGPLIEAYERYIATPKESLDPALQNAARYELAELYLCNTGDFGKGTHALEQALAAAADYPRAANLLRTGVDRAMPGPLALLSEKVAREINDEPLLLQALWSLTEKPPDSTASAAAAEDAAIQLNEAIALATRLNDPEKLHTLLSRSVNLSRTTRNFSNATQHLLSLAGLEQERRHFSKAAELLEEALEHCDPTQRFELELTLAQVLRPENSAKAASILEQLAELEPGDPRTWQPLLEIHRENGNKDALEVVLARAERHVTDDQLKQALQLERVRVLLAVGRSEDAAASLRRLIKETPDNVQAVDLYVELLEQSGSDTELRELLEAQLHAAIARGDQSGVAHHALNLGRRIETEDPESAVRVYRMANAASRRNRPILEALLRLIPEAEPNDRADVLESIVPTEAPEDVESVALQLAAVRTALRDDAGVERAYELGFQVNPRSQVLRERLEDWYQQKEHWAPLADLYVLDANHQAEPEAALNRFMAAAQILDERLGDAASAGRVMDRALERLGPTPDILERLATYWVTAGVPERPLAALTETLETTDPTPEERAVLLHLRGAVQARAAEHEPRGIVAAVADLEQALALGRSEVREDLVAVLERQLQLADTLADESQERLTLLRLAREFHDVVGPTQLLALLGNWVARHPKDSVIALLQVEQASLAGDHETAAHAALQLFHSSETDVQKRAALLYADACSAFGEPRAAHGVLEEMCRTYPSDKELAAKLRSLYEASNSFEALADLMLREVPEDATQAERHQATLAAAQILQRESPLPARTIDLFEAALALAPEDHATTLGLANACTEGGRIQQACAILETAIKAQGKRRTRELSDLQQAMSRVARIAGDDEGRLAWLDAALQTDRRNGDVAAELAIFAMDREDFETALKALQLITLLKEDCAMSRAEAYLRQAIIAQKKDDPKKGILLARRALATDPGYAAAKEFLAERGQNT